VSSAKFEAIFALILETADCLITPVSVLRWVMPSPSEPLAFVDQGPDLSGNRQIEKVVQFNEEENKAFLAFLKGKLDDPSPFVRMEAGFHIALIRNELGMAKQNEDLIPVFVDLFQHEDLWV
jgi:hypothetical protein